MIIIYTTHWCPYCVSAKKFFTEHNIKYKEINVENENISREDLLKIAGSYTVPQIIINKTSIGGYTELIKLYQDKKLESMINE